MAYFDLEHTSYHFRSPYIIESIFLDLAAYLALWVRCLQVGRLFARRKGGEVNPSDRGAGFKLLYVDESLA